MDSIGDFLTRIRNAMRAGKEKLTVPSSKLTVKIAEILKKEGFIDNYKVIEQDKKLFMRIHLRYIHGRQPAIRAIHRVSTPGLRRYVGHQDVPKVLGGLGIAIVSTSRGVLTDKDARREKLGGEVLCKVW